MFYKVPFWSYDVRLSKYNGIDVNKLSWETYQAAVKARMTNNPWCEVKDGVCGRRNEEVYGVQQYYGLEQELLIILFTQKGREFKTDYNNI